MYIGCTGETARARHRRGHFGDLTIGKPIGWNGVIVIKSEMDDARIEIARKAKGSKTARRRMPR